MTAHVSPLCGTTKYKPVKMRKKNEYFNIKSTYSKRKGDIFSKMLQTAMFKMLKSCSKRRVEAFAKCLEPSSRKEILSDTPNGQTLQRTGLDWNIIRHVIIVYSICTSVQTESGWSLHRKCVWLAGGRERQVFISCLSWLCGESFDKQPSLCLPALLGKCADAY